MPNALFLISATFLLATTAMQITDSHDGHLSSQSHSLSSVQHSASKPQANLLTTGETDALRTGKVERWVF